VRPRRPLVAPENPELVDGEGQRGEGEPALEQQERGRLGHHLLPAWRGFDPPLGGGTAARGQPITAGGRDQPGVMRVILLPWMPSPAISPFWSKKKA
jgi:hypothetical protein